MSNDRLVEKLRLILKQKHIYDLNTLNEQLVRDSSLSKEEILRLLVKLIKSEVKSYDVDSKKILKTKYIYKCFKYLCLSENLECIEDYNSFLGELSKVQEDLFCKMQKNVPSMSPNYYAIDKFLRKINNNIDLVRIRLNEVMINKNIYSKDYVEDNIKFVNYLIYNVKNIGYLEEIFKIYPQLMYLKVDNDKYIIDDLITKYIDETAKKDNNNLILYYQEVIKLILSSAKFSISKKHQGLIIKRLELEKNNLDYCHLNKSNKKKQKFFIDEIIDLIQNSNVMEQDTKAFNINYKYNINVGFPKKVRDEIEELEKNKYIINEYGDFYDYSNKNIITIDSDNTIIFDDAFSFEKLPNGNYLLNIYVTDVSRYVKDNSATNKAAFERTSTIYLPDQNLNMLPDYFNKELCSLNEGNHYYAISYEYVFSEDLTLINFDIKKALIKISKNYSYSSLDFYINYAKDTKSLEYFNELFKFASKLKSKNLFNRNYHFIKSLAKKNIDGPEYTSNYSAMVSDFMILTNHMISEKMKEIDGLYIYRNNISSIDDKNLSELNISLNNENNIAFMIERLSKMYVPSYYSLDNEGHMGLNIASYGHNTSPIRRYADLENQRLIKEQLINGTNYDGKKLYELEDKLKERCTYINERTKLNEQYVKEYCLRLKKY